MSWITVVWSMFASACLTFAAIYCLVWYRNRESWAPLFFAMTAAATAAFTFCELRMMRAETPEEFVTAMRWAHVPLFFWLVSLTWFVRTYLGAGRLWLAWAICGLRAFSLLLNFLATQNLNYRELPRLRQVQFLGESFTVAQAAPNPWMLVGQLAALTLLIFVADASVTAWRRGDRRKALMVGGSITFFVLAALGWSVAVLWGYLHAPIVFSVLYLGLVAAMAYELSDDVIRASRLVRELQASEAGLHESEARMSLAVEAGDLGLWIWDLVRHEIWGSDRWRTLFGFGPTGQLDVDDVLQRVHPDDREALRQARAMAIAGSNGGRYQSEYRLILPDGVTRWILSQGRVELDATGQPVVMRGTARDVTARKHAEQEAQLLQQQIAHAARVSMMGQLATALAHEINQPLGAILRNAAAAELHLQRPSPDLDELREIVADIHKDDERAGQVIDRMRALLRRHTLETRRLDVGVLVGDVVTLVRADAATRQVKLDVDVPGDLQPVQGDRVHLQQVLLNLILNGMDALDGAGVEDRRVSVTARLHGGRVVEIAVGDGGPGIPADLLPRIFDPFFTTKPNGMGVGLAISRTIIQAHGGRLWVENKPGGGTVFRFTLPVAEETAE